MTKTAKETPEIQEPVTENNCNVDKTRELISDLYKNATMAQNCIKTLLPYVMKQEVTKALHKQVEQYDHYIEQIGELGETLNFEPTPAPKMAILMANMALKGKMIADQSLTHVAKIMLQGTLNGLIDLYRMLGKNDDVHPEAQLLTKQLLRFEEGCFESMKTWL